MTRSLNSVMIESFGNELEEENAIENEKENESEGFNFEIIRKSIENQKKKKIATDKNFNNI